LGEGAEIAGGKRDRSCGEGDFGGVAKPVAVRDGAIIKEERAAVCDFDPFCVVESSVGFEDKLCPAYDDVAEEVGGVFV